MWSSSARVGRSAAGVREFKFFLFAIRTHLRIVVKRWTRPRRPESGRPARVQGRRERLRTAAQEGEGEDQLVHDGGRMWRRCGHGRGLFLREDQTHVTLLLENWGWKKEAACWLFYYWGVLEFWNPE